MSQETEANAEGVDFALVAYREEGVWQVEELDDERPPTSTARRASCAATPATAAPSGWSRSTRTSSCWSGCSAPRRRLLLSDVTAATDWPIARVRGRPPRRCRCPTTRRTRSPPATSASSPTWACGADGHGRAARRLRPLPRRDARRHRRPSSASAGSTTSWSASQPPVTAARPRGTPRCARPSTRRARRRPRPTYPSGRWCSTRPARWSAAAATAARPTPTRPAHAEVRRAARGRGRPREWRLDGCTLVVTLEPCTMCAGAIVLSRVDRLVFGAFDDKAGAVGSLWDVVRDRRLNHRPEVVGGVLADESAALLLEFFAAPPRARPADFGATRRVRYPRPAVACPSGLRSTPRKRVWVQAHRGFKSHRHRHENPRIHAQMGVNLGVFDRSSGSLGTCWAQLPASKRVIT